MRLIDADKMVHYQTYDDEHEEYPEYTSTIADLIDMMTDEGCPEAVDAVTVIRCKDCKHNPNPPEYGNADCDIFDGMTDQMGYCHWAERREDD
jgi:hypothetical protein